MKRSATLERGFPTPRNFLRENKLLLLGQTSKATMRERERFQPGYELPTTASMGRRTATPPLIETQRRLVEGGRLGRAFHGLAAGGGGGGDERFSGQRSEKQIQTEDISDEQFLSAALLKLEQGHSQTQASLSRAACSEGDELPPSLAVDSADDSTLHLRRSASNYELGKRSSQRRSCNVASLSCTRQPQQRQQLDDVAAQVTPDADAAEQQAAGSPPALQLSIPDITDVESQPELDQPLSTRSHASDTAAGTNDAKTPPETEQKAEQELKPQGLCQSAEPVLLTESQRVALLQAAQARHNDLIWQYNRLPLSMGTLRVRNLKVMLENELDRLDGDLNMLTLPQVYI
ncbi:hypothetical protein KR044_009772, partial [Drosophila immigrans]